MVLGFGLHVLFFFLILGGLRHLNCFCFAFATFALFVVGCTFLLPGGAGVQTGGRQCDTRARLLPLLRKKKKTAWASCLPPSLSPHHPALALSLLLPFGVMVAFSPSTSFLSLSLYFPGTTLHLLYKCIYKRHLELLFAACKKKKKKEKKKKKKNVPATLRAAFASL